MCTRLVVACLLPVLVIGCGGSDSSPVSSGSETASLEPSSQRGPVTASIRTADSSGTPDGGNTGAARLVVEEQDPIRQKLNEIQQLRVSAADGSDPNNAIVLRATEVLKLTMQDASRQEEFLEAIRQLLQARMQLALAGGQEEIELLYSDVRALSERDENSAAAAEGIYYLARFAHTKGRQLRQRNLEWYVDFSRWAREFAQRFPEQKERSLSLLFGAGRSCEMNAAKADDDEMSARLRAEAKLCYFMLFEHWSEESQGQEAAAVLRRFNLPGKELSQFSGQCLDGTHVTAKQLPGKITLIYFWDSGNGEFAEGWVPDLKNVESKLGPERIRFIGVNLDEDRQTCEAEVSRLELPGDQIFSDDENTRGWNSPLVRFWGVSQSPSVWLVAADGIVDAVDLRKPELIPHLRALLQARSGSQ